MTPGARSRAVSGGGLVTWHEDVVLPKQMGRSSVLPCSGWVAARGRSTERTPASRRDLACRHVRRNQFISGREEIVKFLTAKWERELDYVLRKSLWGFRENRIAVRFQYECHDSAGQPLTTSMILNMRSPPSRRS